MLSFVPRLTIVILLIVFLLSLFGSILQLLLESLPIEAFERLLVSTIVLSLAEDLLRFVFVRMIVRSKYWLTEIALFCAIVTVIETVKTVVALSQYYDQAQYAWLAAIKYNLLILTVLAVARMIFHYAAASIFLLSNSAFIIITVAISHSAYNVTQLCLQTTGSPYVLLYTASLGMTYALLLMAYARLSGAWLKVRPGTLSRMNSS